MKNYFSSYTNQNKLNSNEQLYKSQFTEEEFLNDLSCQKIYSILRKNYFDRAEKSSLKNYLPKINTSSDLIQHPIIKKSNVINKRNKSLLMSDRVRKRNMKNINACKSYNSVIGNKVLKKKKEDNKVDENEDQSKVTRKAKLPKIVKKKVYDPFPISYETKYIDNVENKFIKPYFNSDNEYYTEIKEIKRSNIPFYFNIGST